MKLPLGGWILRTSAYCDCNDQCVFLRSFSSLNYKRTPINSVIFKSYVILLFCDLLLYTLFYTALWSAQFVQLWKGWELNKVNGYAVGILIDNRGLFQDTFRFSVNFEYEPQNMWVKLAGNWVSIQSVIFGVIVTTSPSLSVIVTFIIVAFR
jgi:hypothetical protein